MDLTKKYNRKDFVNFLRNEFLPEDFELGEEEIPVVKSWKKFREVTELGKSDELDLTVLEIKHDSVNDPRVTLTRDSFDMLKKYSSTRNALVAYFCEHDSKWRFSFITFSVRKNEKGKLERDNSNPRRYSFLLGEGCKRHTPETMLFAKGRVTSVEDLQKRFAIEVVTKEFYAELFSWYEWACKLCKFPVGNGRNVSMTQDDNATHIIRLITRLMFVWFIKQKDLIPDWVFDRVELEKILVNFKPTSDARGNYYNAVLQNLFFATLNKEIGERKFAENSDEKYKEDYGIKSFYRDDIKKSFFKISTDEVVKKFEGVPFLNGGLFECLDKFDEDIKNKNVQKYIDGFSRESGRRALVPNCLFWDEEKGLVAILSRYNFTVEENTPLDVDIALDPELLGKVFENLLGTYNPETKETARKESGSFYTPREIVAYMVDESLKSYLLNACHVEPVETSAIDLSTTVEVTEHPVIDALFSDDNEPLDLSQKQKMQISHALKNVKVFDPACGSGAFPMGMLQRIMSLLRKLGVDDLGTNESAYNTKLHIIENCLYGSDIQTIAVQIAKLRFFITLICEQEKTFDKNNNYGFHALPNLETKFVAANTLIGLSKKYGYSGGMNVVNKDGNNFNVLLFQNEELPKIKAELADIRKQHFHAETAKNKKLYRNEDEKLRKKLADILVKNKDLEADDAEQLAAWNPYDQNTASEFFDAEWMFGVDGGFDIVIGNPPYVQLQSNAGTLAKIYEPCQFKSFARTGDIYCLFYEKGYELLKKGGYLCFITSNKWMRAGYGEKLRKFFAENTNPKLLIDFAGVQVFESATVDTNILLFSKSKNAKRTQACVTKNLNANGGENLSVFVQQNSATIAFDNSQSWVILSPIEQSIKQKIEKTGTPLKNWDINIYRGVLTGFNEAFIISGDKKQEILANCKTDDERKRTDELIRPILRGRDIKRYGYDFADLWLINTHNGIKEKGIPRIDVEKDFPAIKKHLDEYWNKLEKRADKGDTPYNLRNCAYLEDFDKPKIVWGNLNLSATFALAPSGMMINAPATMIVPASNYLLCVLNSKLADYYIRNLGVTRNGGYFEYKPMFIEQLPVPSEKNDNMFSENDNEEIDRKVYELYGLSEEEINFIENL